MTNFISNIEEWLSEFVGVISSDKDLARLDRVSETESGASWRITPKNPQSTPILVHADVGNGFVDIGIGEDTALELSPDSYYTSAKTLPGELEAILTAIVEGKFEETIWRQDNSIVKSKALLQVLGEDIEPGTNRHLGSSLFVKDSTKTTKVYEAYKP